VFTGSRVKTPKVYIREMGHSFGVRNLDEGTSEKVGITRSKVYQKYQESQSEKNKILCGHRSCQHRVMSSSGTGRLSPVVSLTGQHGGSESDRKVKTH